MSKTITLPLDEYEALEVNANKYLGLKNIEIETDRLKKAHKVTVQKLNVERDNLTSEISYMNAQAAELKNHLTSEQANMPIVLEKHHRYDFMRIQELVPFNRLKPYYENETDFIRFVSDTESKALKSKDSILSFIVLSIFAFAAGALLF